MSDFIKRHGGMISLEQRSLITQRYHAITKAVNNEFWNSSSDTSHSLYVGSYGRGTAIDSSDIDVLIELPKTDYNKFNELSGNSQSRLLQAVREAILKSYPRSDVHADGQVVKIIFSDDMKFEILPAFKLDSWSEKYKYPDSNMGGKWCSTNPKAEQVAMQLKNESSNGLLYDTCKHIRYVRDYYYKSYHLAGIVIDSFVYEAINGWKWLKGGESSTSESGDYENMLYNYLHKKVFRGTLTLSAPGSNETVIGNSSVDCLERVMKHIAE